MKKIIIPIVIVLIIALGVIFYFMINKPGSKLSNKYASVITLDNNVGYEIYLDKNNKVIKFIKYKDNKKETITNEVTLDNIYDLIKNESREYMDEFNGVVILVNNEGIIDLDDIEKSLNSSNDIRFDIRNFKSPTKNDTELANKYTISTVKATLINNVAKKIKEVNIEDLINKTIAELINMEERGYYCPDNYKLKGDCCYKEIARTEPLIGKLCPNDYYEYNGICYKIGEDQEGEKLVCQDSDELIGEDCIQTETHIGEAVCEKGEFNGKDCIYMEDVGEPEEYCYDPNRYYYEHKCLATKPLLNGGCPGDENAKRNNRCVNFKDDMQDSSKRCGKGETLYPYGDGIFRCIKESKYPITGYSCGPDEPLQDNNKCSSTHVYRAAKEKICINGSTLVNNDICIIKNETSPKVERPYCDKEHSFLQNSMCIEYDDIKALISE